MSDVLEIRVGESVQAKATFGEGDGITRYRSVDGSLYSVDPPTAYLTFGPWIYQVPPYKPKNVLMLGYAGGTVAGLIRLLYGDVPITGVDLQTIDNRYGVTLVCADARTFVQRDLHYDAVIIDIFNGDMTPEFVASYEFAQRISQIADRFLIVHADPTANIGIYEQFFHRLRIANIGHTVYYFKRFSDPTEYFPT